MISPDEAARVTQFTTTVAALWLGYWFLYRPFIVDRFRQDLFAIRDKLFDDAARHKAFADPTYRGLRQSLNSMIFMASRLGPTYMIAVAFFHALEKTKVEALPTPTGGAPLIAEAVEVAKKKFVTRVFNFLVWDHLLTGLPSLVILAVMGWLNNRRHSVDRNTRRSPVVLLIDRGNWLGASSGSRRDRIFAAR